jgi:hypothetical protein
MKARDAWDDDDHQQMNATAAAAASSYSYRDRAAVASSSTSPPPFIVKSGALAAVRSSYPRCHSNRGRLLSLGSSSVLLLLSIRVQATSVSRWLLCRSCCLGPARRSRRQQAAQRASPPADGSQDERSRRPVRAAFLLLSILGLFWAVSEDPQARCEHEQRLLLLLSAVRQHAEDGRAAAGRVRASQSCHLRRLRRCGGGADWSRRRRLPATATEATAQTTGRRRRSRRWRRRRRWSEAEWQQQQRQSLLLLHWQSVLFSRASRRISFSLTYS